MSSDWRHSLHWKGLALNSHAELKLALAQEILDFKIKTKDDEAKRNPKMLMSVVIYKNVLDKAFFRNFQGPI